MIDGRTVDDILPESKSAQEVSALWMYLRGRLAKLYGGTDARWAQKARADFSTAVLTPEGPLLPAAAVSAEDDEDWDADLPAWASLAIANATGANGGVDRRRAADAPRGNGVPNGQKAATAVLEPPVERQLERRRGDRGPPPGQPDRRQARVFGRRPTH